MSDILRQITLVKDAEDRRVVRFESRTKFTQLVLAVHDALVSIDKKLAEIESEANGIADQTHQKGMDTRVESRRNVLGEDVSDLFEQLELLCEVICPAGELLTRYKNQLKHRFSSFM